MKFILLYIIYEYKGKSYKSNKNESGGAKICNVAQYRSQLNNRAGSLRPLYLDKTVQRQW